MPTGKVKWFNEIKGFGMLRETGGPDVPVHFSSIVGEGFRTLSEGEAVEFDVRNGPRGPEAAGVRRLNV
ncbi:MAG: cold shock domain-containing protein [Candidatus Eisenbacteria bacterium]